MDLSLTLGPSAKNSRRATHCHGVHFVVAALVAGSVAATTVRHDDDDDNQDNAKEKLGHSNETVTTTMTEIQHHHRSLCGGRGCQIEMGTVKTYGRRYVWRIRSTAVSMIRT